MSELYLGTPTIKTKAQASIDEFGADSTGGSTEEFLVYEVTWSPLVSGVATCPANAEGCPVGEEYEYTSIEFELQIFGGVTETPTMPSVPALTSLGDVVWFSDTHSTIGGTTVVNPQTTSYNDPTLPVFKYITIAASALTNPVVTSYVIGRFHLQIAAGNERSNITTVIAASRRTLSMTSGSRNYMSALTAMDANHVYTVPAFEYSRNHPDFSTHATAPYAGTNSPPVTAVEYTAAIQGIYDDEPLTKDYTALTPSFGIIDVEWESVFWYEEGYVPPSGTAPFHLGLLNMINGDLYEDEPWTSPAGLVALGGLDATVPNKLSVGGVTPKRFYLAYAYDWAVFAPSLLGPKVAHADKPIALYHRTFSAEQVTNLGITETALPVSSSVVPSHIGAVV